MTVIEGKDLVGVLVEETAGDETEGTDAPTVAAPRVIVIVDVIGGTAAEAGADRMTGREAGGAGQGAAVVAAAAAGIEG